MKKIKTITVPATTREVVESVSCDLCGDLIQSFGYEVDEVTVLYRTGTNYPECGSGEETSVDLCGECFNKKLVPWLRSQGAEPRTEEWDW